MTMKWKAAAAASLVGALALSGCGGSTGASSGGGRPSTWSASRSSSRPTSRSSPTSTRPPPARASASSSRTAPPATRAAPSSAARRPTSCTSRSSPTCSKLVDAELVADDWKDDPTKGILTQSVVVIVVRKGNPKGIKTWDDLVKPGVKIITPNPASSGSARWNILAACGHVLANGGTEARRQGLPHQVLQATSSRCRAAAATPPPRSPGGNGDVLLSYENEAILARQSGADFDYVVPDETLLIQNPGAVTTDAAPKAKASWSSSLGKQAQTDYAEDGLPPARRRHQGRRSRAPTTRATRSRPRRS